MTTGEGEQGVQMGRVALLRGAVPGTYYGEIYGGAAGGHGVAEFDDGSAYSGAWRAGKPHGAGKYLHQGGNFWGYYAHGRRSGLGQLEEGCYSDCARWDGEVRVMGIEE